MVAGSFFLVCRDLWTAGSLAKQEKSKEKILSMCDAICDAAKSHLPE